MARRDLGIDGDDAVADIADRPAASSSPSRFAARRSI